MYLALLVCGLCRLTKSIISTFHYHPLCDREGTALWGFMGSGEIYSDKQLPGNVSDGELLLEPDKYGTFQLGYPMGVPFMGITASNLKQCSAEHKGFWAEGSHLQLEGPRGNRNVEAPISKDTFRL
jgi:hypothetical protein